MSYQVLARKYRPSVFKELEGQEHVLKALINALDNDRLHHAYLFTGTRGVGKTTIARILARCLNCEQGVTSEPCRVCTTCVEISEGRSVDLIEVDAASRTGVDDMRELLDNVQYMPSTSRFKVYLIDEVHMLSRSSFNAMLKTLEEPPGHVKFLFATTDPKKLPVTVLSRCLQFNLKKLSPEEIVKCLVGVLGHEDIEYDESALWQLGHAAEGSMRDALSMTDHAISFGNNEVRDEAVRTMLGNIESKVAFQLLADITANNGAHLLETVARLSDFAADYEALLDDILSVLHRIAIAQAIPGSVDNSLGDKQEILGALDSMSSEQVQLLYQIGLIGQRDLPLAPTTKAGFEMVLLRMMHFTPLSLGGERPKIGAERSTGPEEIDGLERSTRGINNAPSDNLTSIKKGITEHGDQEKGTVLPSMRQSGVPLGRRKVKEDLEQETFSIGERNERYQASEKEIVNEDQVPILDTQNWKNVLAELNLTGVTRTLAANCLLQSTQGGHCVLKLGEDHASLWNVSHEERIASALHGLYGRPFTVTVEVGEIEVETPAEIEAREHREQKAKAVAEIEGDKYVQQLIENFDGRIDTESVSPLSTGDV